MTYGTCPVAGDGWTCNYDEGRLSNGMCPSHYSQKRRGLPFKQVLRRKNSRAVEGLRWCGGCAEYKPIEKFYANASMATKSQAGRNYRCADCNREYKLRNMYGITIQQYNKILDLQGGGCAICGTKACNSGRSFSVDHDHDCCPGAKSCGRCVRGLLCNQCNQGIGKLGDNPETLRRAASYIEMPAAYRMSHLFGSA